MRQKYVQYVFLTRFLHLVHFPSLSRYVFGSGEERNMRAMMGSALGGADFEWAKTGDLQAEYMDTSETLGNDLDKVDIDPQFQV